MAQFGKRFLNFTTKHNTTSKLWKQLASLVIYCKVLKRHIYDLPAWQTVMMSPEVGLTATILTGEE